MKDQLNQVYKKRLFVILSLFFVVMTIALTVVQVRQTQDLRSSAATIYTNCAVGENLLADDTEEHDLGVRINNYRVQNNLPGLTTHPALTRAAAWQARDMAQRGVLNHTDSLGREPLKRLEDCTFAPAKKYSEAIAKGQTSGQQVFDAWKNSPDHNAVLLCRECDYIGLARDRMNGGAWFWTLDVGKTDAANAPKNPSVTTSPPVVVTKGPTPTPEVTLPPAKTELPDGTTGVYASVYIPGIEEYGNPHPRHPNRPLTITVYDRDNKEITKADSIVSYDPNEEVFYGAIELPATLESGTYIIKAKTDKSITRTVFSGFLTIEKGKVLELPLVTLPTVDLDGNNAITIADVNIFKKCLDSEKCSRQETDLDDNGELDINDYFVFSDVFGYFEGE